MTVAGERSGAFDPNAFFDVMQNLLITGLVTDQEQPQAVVPHHRQEVARHVGLGIARPSDAEPAECLGKRGSSRRIVGERIVVKEELAYVRKRPPRPGNLVHHMSDAAGAVTVTSYSLWPQTKCAARFAATTGVD